MKFLFRSVAAVAILAGTYWFFPKHEIGEITIAYPEVPASPEALEAMIADRESKVENLRPDNEGRFVWYDSTKSKTPYSLVYLHGFSASQFEGNPLHLETAARYGMNLYLPRLAGHGIGSIESFKDITPDEYMDSAMEAIAIAKQMGDKVLVMGTSTGATLGLSALAFDSTLVGGLFYSPNIDIADPSSHILRRPFGMSLARSITGSDYHQFSGPPIVRQYWTTKYRMEGILMLREFLDKTMVTETFEKVKQPVMVLAYYKNEDEQDEVVSVAAMELMFEQLGTESDKKLFKKLPTVGDHVMTCITHSDDLDAVRTETNQFIEKVLGLKPVKQISPQF